MLGVFIQVLVPVLLIFCAGYILGKFFFMDSKTLSTLSIYVLTPCLIFQAILQYHDFWSAASLHVFLSVSILIALTILVTEILAKLFRWDKSFKTVVLLTLTLTNSGNYGLPISEYAHGKEGLYSAILLMVTYIFYTHTAGVIIAASDKAGWKEAFKRMLQVPVFYALALALILNYLKIQIPKPVFSPIQSIGLAAIPMNLLIVGINLSQVKSIRNFWPVFAVSAGKLLAIPVAAYIILKLFGVENLLFKVSMTQIAMPSAVYCSILASHFGSDGELASEIVLVSLLLSTVTLTALIFGMQTGWIS